MVVVGYQLSNTVPASCSSTRVSVGGWYQLSATEEDYQLSETGEPPNRTGTQPDRSERPGRDRTRETGTPPNRSESPGRHRTGPRDQDATDRVRPFTLNAWIAGGGRLPAGGGHFLAGSVGSVAKAYLAGSAHGAVKA